MTDINNDMSAMDLSQLNELDLTNTSTAYPCLQECVARVRISDMLIKPNKANTGKVLHVKLALDSDGLLFDDGKPANKGWVHTEPISLTKTDKYDPFPNLAKLQECFIGQKGQIDWNSLRGQWGDVKFRIYDDPEYGKRNRVSSWIPKQEDSVGASL